MDAFQRCLLEIVPKQKTKHQPKLRKSELSPITPRLANDIIEHSRNVRRVFEPQVLAERHRRTLRDGCGKLRVPHEKLLQLDVAVIQEQRHGGHREIESL